MPRQIRSEKILYRKRFVAKAIGYTNATEKQIAARLGITESGVSRIAKKQGVKRKYPLKTGPKGQFQSRLGKILNSQRFVAKAIGYTRATQKQIAARLGITERHVRRIAKQVGAVRRYPPKRGPKGPSRRRLLTADEKNRIRELRAKKGLSEQRLAELFGRSQPAIHNVLKHQ
jgi:transcriptional regulator with XRE-family HTH domain